MVEQRDGYERIIRTLSTKSAANPALILAALCLLAGTSGAAFFEGWIQLFFLFVIIIGVLVPAIQIVYFTLTDPDRLQDEKHIENKMMIERQTGLGDSERFIVIDPDTNLTSNTQLEDLS